FLKSSDESNMRLIPLGELIGIDKGKKPARLFAQPAPGRHRFLQIDDLRPNAIPKFVESFACPKASRTDVIIAWDGANAGTVACNLEGYVGSTLAVLRLDDSKVDAAYVSRFLEGQFHRLQATAKGATVPHLSRDFVEELRIPLPEFSEQKRVAAILERADRLWRLRRYSLQMYENFLSVAYLRLFGDPRTNPKKIPIAELGKYIAFLTSGSRGWAEHYAKSGARFIRSLD